MAERKVTADGVNYDLAPPFFLIATQNPIDHEGTFPLPEAQLDRFLVRLSLGYPQAESESPCCNACNAHPIDDLEKSPPRRKCSTASGGARGSCG
jgi:MoxR-like ATPase